jgi:glycosyltransferase involved in cell wall biosynthesis
MRTDRIKDGVSVVICCYNSERLLPTTLEHISHQNVANNLSWEVIIVDNASTDQTKLIANQETRNKLKNIKFKIVDQPIQGLTAAREKGIREALFDFVVFCDDDNWLDSNYVQSVYEIMSSNSSIGVLGGKGLAISDEQFPDWFEKYHNNFAVGSQNDQSGDITNSKGWVNGAGFVIRKSVWLLIKQNGFKHLLTGREGRGQDVEMCLAVRLAGYRIWYDKRLIFKHFIWSERLTWKYFLNLSEIQHQAIPIFSAYNYILNINGNDYERPSRWFWLTQSTAIVRKLTSDYRLILKLFFKKQEYELEGNSRVRRLRHLRGELRSWLSIRSNFVSMCDDLYLLRNKIKNHNNNQSI